MTANTLPLNTLKACPQCGADTSTTRDDRTICYICNTPLEELSPSEVPSASDSQPIPRHLPMLDWLSTIQIQKPSRRTLLIGGLSLGLFGMGFTIFKGINAVSSSPAIGANQTVVLGDTFVGYSALRSPEFQAMLKSIGIYLTYTDEFDQAARAQKLSNGEADLMVTSLDQVLRHQPDGKIVAMWDKTQGADAVVLNTKKFPLLKDMNALAQEVKIAAQAGQQYSIVYAKDTPSEYLALLLASKFPSFRLEDFKLVSVADASEAYKALEDPSQNIALAVLWEPFVSKVGKSGHKVVLSSADVPNAIVDVLVASDEFIEDEPDKLRSFVGAYYARVDSSRLDGTALKQQIATEAKISDPKITDPQVLKILKGIHFFNAKEADQWLNGNQILERIDYTASVLTASGRLAQFPSEPQQLFTGQFLDLAVANNQRLDQHLSREKPPAAPAKAKVPSTPKPVAKVGKISEDISFELGSVLLSNKAKSNLNTVLQTAKGFGGSTAIQVTGHTSTTGTPERNAILGKGRVEAVTHHLKGKGFQGQLLVKAAGESMPLPGIPKEDPRQQRVEVEVVRTGE